MPSATLPSFTRAQVESHNSEKSCYCIVGELVYDITDFISSHPGGGDLILDYAGKDVSDILRDEASHLHSEAAYEILEESIVGCLITENGINGTAVNGSAKSTGVQAKETEGNGTYVHPRTGMSCAEDLTKDTDYVTDYKKHKFLDLNRPLFPQVWYGGFTKEFYLDQVHRPRHYKGGASAPIFGNFLEPLTKTPWYSIPIFWLPMVIYLTWYSAKGFDSVFTQAAAWFFGWFFFSFVEYSIHRFLFHVDYYLPDNRVGISLHFLLHGVHHYLPMDRYRLVLPPTLFIILGAPFWKLAHFVFYWDWYLATTAFSGGVFGYICYDLTHYFLHHNNLPLWYKDLKKYHLAHHFLEYELGFGITNKFWDKVFGTELILEPRVKSS